MPLPRTSLIISVYNNEKDLKVILDSLKFQTVAPDEIIISEDGDRESMRSFLRNYPIQTPLFHLYRPDIGWSKNAALNDAILKANNEYLIFIDGDCVLHPKYIEMHRKLARPNHVLAGKRIKLGVSYSNQLYQTPLPEFQEKIIQESRKIKKDGAEFYEEAIYIPLNPFTRMFVRKMGITSIKGCNFSCYKNAMIRINGFDEDYVKPAVGEDHDLVWRFKGLGYQIVSVKHFAIQYHLFHPEIWTNQSENMALYDEKVKLGNFVCKNGILKF